MCAVQGVSNVNMFNMTRCMERQVVHLDKGAWCQGCAVRREGSYEILGLLTRLLLIVHVGINIILRFLLKLSSGKSRMLRNWKYIFLAILYIRVILNLFSQLCAQNWLVCI